MKPDDICREYSESGVQIKVTELEDKYILIEGTHDALQFLSKLISAQAESNDDGFHIGPFDAGCAWFAPGSTKGIYIRCVMIHRDLTTEWMERQIPHNSGKDE